MQEMRVWSLGWEDPLEKEMATHSSILAWEVLWTEEPGGLQSMESQRAGLNLATKRIRGVCLSKAQGTSSCFPFWIPIRVHSWSATVVGCDFLLVEIGGEQALNSSLLAYFSAITPFPPSFLPSLPPFLLPFPLSILPSSLLLLFFPHYTWIKSNSMDMFHNPEALFLILRWFYFH